MPRPRIHEFKLTPEQSQVVADNFSLVGVAFKKVRSGKIKEHYGNEILLAGHYGLVKAAILYKPEHGIFSSFAVRCIYNEMILWIIGYENKNKKLQTISLETRAGKTGDPGENKNMTLGDILPDTTVNVEEAGINRATIDEIYYILDHCVNETDARFMKMYASGMSIIDIAEAEGCTRQRVDQRIKRAREIILRKYNYGWETLDKIRKM